MNGASHYSGEVWSVVLRRKLSTSKDLDPVFVPGEATSLILAVWNGGGDEVNGRKSVTYQWIPAKLDGIGSTTVKSDVGVEAAGQ